MLEEIDNYLESLDLDIRRSRNARFMDQKVTPDVLCIISDCILKYLEIKEDDNIEFTSKDIWDFEYSNTNIKEIFTKADVSNVKAKNEYDKFFQQPLKALSYANILKEEKRGKRIFFSVKNIEILRFISIKERNALDFLNIYLEKVLKDSDLWDLFNTFFDNNTKEDFNKLKISYERFIIKYTPINGKTEVRRIFTKVLNPLSFKRQKHGTNRGYFSKDVISSNELMYNRKNWRDLKKKKTETRREYEIRAKEEIEYSKNAYIKYTVNKAINIVKKLHSPVSEVTDNLSVGEATQVHHIFMKSEFPQIESYIENLILLTATQHSTKAHPGNNTRLINKDYQLICLLAKSQSIESNKNIYSKEDFLYVLKIGLNQELSLNTSFDEIKQKLIEIYHS